MQTQHLHTALECLYAVAAKFSGIITTYNRKDYLDRIIYKHHIVATQPRRVCMQLGRKVSVPKTTCYIKRLF
jgi:hypothetical protein